MDAMVIGATFVGSIATAFVVQKAVLGAMLRAFERGKSPPAVIPSRFSAFPAKRRVPKLTWQ